METFAPLEMALRAKPAGSLGNVLVGVAAYLGKSFLLYQPMKETINDFKPYGMEGIAITARTTDSLTLCGYIFSPKECPDKTKIPTVLYFHENAGTIGHRFSYFSSYVNKCQVNLVVFGYRGYSKSPGHPSMSGLMKDADAIMEKLFKDYGIQYGFEKIFLHGKSLGGGVASYVGSQEKWRAKVSGVILDSTFNSVPRLISDIIPVLKKDGVDRDIFENENWEVLGRVAEFESAAPVPIQTRYSPVPVASGQVTLTTYGWLLLIFRVLAYALFSRPRVWCFRDNTKSPFCKLRYLSSVMSRTACKSFRVACRRTRSSRSRKPATSSRSCVVSSMLSVITIDVRFGRESSSNGGAPEFSHC